MSVPSNILDLSTNTASNSPLGSENVGSPGSVDDYFRAGFAIMKVESLIKSWENRGDSPAYVSGTTFTMPGDETVYYSINRRVLALGGSVIYGVILSSSYNGVVTTTTILPDSGALDASLSTVLLGIDPKSVSVIFPAGTYYSSNGGELHGNISMSNNSVVQIKNLGFYAEYDNGNSGAGPKTIDWSNGQNQKITLNAATPALVVLPAPYVSHYQLRLIEDAAGARVPTFSGISASRWMNSAAQPTFNTAANGETIITFYWDGATFSQAHQRIGVA